MTENALKLDRPPIIEAVVDIQCDLPPQLALEDIALQAKEAFRDVYPVARKLRVQHHEVTASPQTGARLLASQRVTALQFHLSDGKQIVQIREEGYSFNRLAPYSSLDDYLPEIERTWRLFRELVEPVQLRRVGLRYINRLSLPTDDDRLQISRYLRVTPLLPESGTLEFTGFLNQQSAVETRSGNGVNITVAMEPFTEDRLPIILDIDTFDLTARTPEDWEQVRDAILSLRRLKNLVFERMLTPECLNLYRQP
jgi:uncharacterized protein (TIGR04255 family)